MSVIDLHDEPSIDDFNYLISKAEEDCYCTEEMRTDLRFDTNPETCLPCACRFALNAITSVAERVRMEIN